MRDTMGIIPYLLALCVVPAVASPINYTIDFTLTSGSPPPISGGFSYDSSTSTFTSFNVVWDGYMFNLTSAANSVTFTSPTDPCYSGSSTGSQEAFLLLTRCAADANPSYYGGAPYYLANVYPYGSPNYTAFGFATNTGGSGPNQINVAAPAQGTSFCPPSTCFTYSVQAVGAFEASAPEPGTWALTVIGLCVVMSKRVPSKPVPMKRMKETFPKDVAGKNRRQLE
jgi:hypothetical protein